MSDWKEEQAERLTRIEQNTRTIIQNQGRFQVAIAAFWSEMQPELPPPPDPPPPHPQVRAGNWRVRNLTPQINLEEDAFMVEWFDGEYYLHANLRGQSGSPETIIAQKFQIRDGKLWGRSGPGGEWNIESPGWEYAGWVDFPVEKT